MSVTLSYDPVTKEVSHYDPSTTLHSLQYSCKKTIISKIGLKYLHLTNKLPLPPDIKSYLSTLKLSDFLIDADKIPPEGHKCQEFPAKCLLTNRDVIIKLVSSESEIDIKNGNFLLAFEENGQSYVVEAPVKTLAEMIDQCKEENIKLDENLIKMCLSKLSNHLLQHNVSVSSHISSKSILITSKNQISIDLSDTDGQQSMMPGLSIAVYEAPEVLNNDNPDSRAFVWSVGCILHEALALEPAFSDPSGTNPFQVYMNITNGIIPPTPSDGSDELQNLLEKCLVHNRYGRMSLEELHKALDTI